MARGGAGPGIAAVGHINQQSQEQQPWQQQQGHWSIGQQVSWAAVAASPGGGGAPVGRPGGPAVGGGVGAGSAGCVLANRLTADGTASVLLLEAGGLEDAAAQVPFFSVILQGTDLDWDYSSERQHNASLSVDDQINRMPRGKVLGGSSSINHVIFARGNRKDFDAWASEYGADGWSYDDVLPDFISIETSYLGIDNARWTDHLSPVLCCSAMLSAHAVEQFPVKNEKYNASVLSVRCSQVLFEGATAVGVEYKRYIGTHSVRAKKEVILCAGAIASPQLLMLSGIGPREHLESLGINVIADLPVGENLFDHITVNGIAATSAENIEINYYLPSTIPLYSLFRTGPLIHAFGVEGIAFLSTPNVDPTHPNIQFLFVTLNPTTPEAGYLASVIGISQDKCNSSDAIITEFRQHYVKINQIKSFLKV
nr:ecdysone oxidase-like [Dermacentor andersoni]